MGMIKSRSIIPYSPTPHFPLPTPHHSCVTGIDISIETMRVIGTLTPRFRCKLNAVQLNVMELGAIKIPIASLHAILSNGLWERHTTK